MNEIKIAFDNRSLKRQQVGGALFGVVSIDGVIIGRGKVRLNGHRDEVKGVEAMKRKNDKTKGEDGYRKINLDVLVVED